ncbi:MAG TPA: hypothetical protein VFW40_13115 [Capsulimonadaceae bacterium]|nr:hypothetical protein [Capsulimonadaceae bacterium]
MFNNQVRQRVRGLVAGIGPSIATNPDLVETKLADLAADNAEDVRLIVSAARAGIPEELATAPQEHRAELVEQASSWMAGETGASQEAARWAVESWAAALEGVQIAPPPQPAAAPIPTSAAPAPDAQPAPAFAATAPPAPWDTPRAPQAAGAPWGVAQPGVYAPPAGLQPGYGAAPGYPANPTDPRSYSRQMTQPATTTSPGRLVAAIVISLVIGAIGSSLIMQMLLSLHHTFAYLYIILGAVVGVCVCQISGVGGSPVMGAIACGVLLCGEIVGHFFFIVQTSSHLGIPTSLLISHMSDLFTPIHWLLVGLSFVACWAAVQRQST